MIRRLLLVTVLTIAVFAPPLATAAGPDDRTVVHITFVDRDDLQRLASRLDVWEVHHTQRVIVAAVTSAELADLVAQGYQVDLDDAKTEKLRTPRAPLPGQVSGIPGYGCYRTVEETYGALQTLASAHPNLVALVDIGDSWEKLTPGGAPGYDLWVAILTNRSIPGPKPVFFLMGEIHAREYVTAETVLRFAESLLGGYGTDADATWLLDHCELHVVPMTNPDGRKKAEAGASWRKNTDSDDGCSTPSSWGTDLNRNSTYKWGGAGSSAYACDETYHGPAAASEPEVQAVQTYIQAIFPDQRGPGDADPAPADATGVMITLHSYGDLVMWPWGWTATTAPNDAALATFGRKMAFFNGYDPGQSIGLYPTTGTTDDWSYAELGVASYTFEMGSEFFEDCSPFESTILPDNLDALRFAFKACRRPYQTPTGPEVIGVACTPSGTAPGGTVTLTATANDTRRVGEGSQAINAARWTVDTPSWLDGASIHPMVASDGSFNAAVEGVEATIDTTGWSLGRHVVMVEARDAGNTWGVPSAALVCVAASPHGIQLTPAQAAGSAGRGQTFTAYLTVHNPGNQPDSYTVAVSGNAWPTGVPATVGPVEPCREATFPVQVTVPTGSAACAIDVATVTVTSLGEPSFTSSAVVTTSSLGLPSATITAPTSVCALATDRTASVPDAGPDFTYAWTIAGGSITTGQGTRSITFSAGTVGKVSLGVTVSRGSECSSSGTAHVTILALPSAAVTAPGGTCAGSAGLVASVANAGVGATYAWTISGGTITAGLGTRSVTFTAGSGPNAVLDVLVTNTRGCSASGSATVPLTQLPGATITTGATHCSGGVGYLASVPAAEPGASYQWTISGGTISGGQGTPVVTYDVGEAGSLTLGVTVDNGGCAASGAVQRTIHPTPSATITAPGALCPGGGYVASVPDAGAGASYQWTIRDGTITSDPAWREVTFTAPPTGTARLDVVVTGSTACSASGRVEIPVHPSASTAITAAASVCPTSSANQASVPDAGPDAAYAWTVSNGLLLGGDGTRAITFQAGASGAVTLGVAIQTGSSCTFTGETAVAIEAAPTPAITGTTATCAGGSLSLSVAGGPFATYLWRKDGETIATGATFIKSDVSTTDAGSYTVEVSTATGCTATSPAVPVTVGAAPALSAGDATVTEGSGGPTTVVVPVTLSAATCVDVTVGFATTAGTATAATDFTEVSGTLTFPAGETSRTVAVPVNPDAIDEVNETFTLHLSSPVNATIADADGLATIADDDNAGLVVAAPAGLVTTEAGGSAAFTVALASQPTAAVTVPIASAVPSEGTAAPATLVFTVADWATPQTVTVTGVDDAVHDGDQPYTVAVGPAASGDPGYGGVSAAGVVLTNQDDDPAVVRGDANGDGVVDVNDAFHLINHLFAGGPAPLAGDENHDGSVDVGDVFYLINHLFAGGPGPA